MRCWMIVGGFCLMIARCYGQQSLFLGNASAILDTSLSDPLNYPVNPAAITNRGSLHGGMFAGKYQGVEGLNFLSGCIAVPLGRSALAFSIFHAGTVGMQENEISLMMAHDLGTVSIGINVSSNLVTVATIGGSASIDVGVGITKTSGQLRLGVAFSHIRMRQGELQRYETKGVSVGLQALFNISELVAVGITASRSPGQAASLQPALFYKAGVLDLSIGFEVSSGSMHLLTGWGLKRLQLKLLIGYQPALGLLQGAQFLYKSQIQ